MGRCVLSFLGLGLPSVNVWLMSLRKRCLVASDAFLIIEYHTVSSPEEVSLKRCNTPSSSVSVNSVSTRSYAAVVMVRTRAGTICIRLLIVLSGKFPDEYRCANELHGE